MDTEIEELLRDVCEEYRCSFSWEPNANKKYPGTCVSFSKTCGDGCCSWSDDYFIDSSSDKRLVEYFEQNPSGNSFSWSKNDL